MLALTNKTNNLLEIYIHIDTKIRHSSKSLCTAWRVTKTTILKTLKQSYTIEGLKGHHTNCN